jgi:hypothetical protein
VDAGGDGQGRGDGYHCQCSRTNATVTLTADQAATRTSAATIRRSSAGARSVVVSRVSRVFFSFSKETVEKKHRNSEEPPFGASSTEQNRRRLAGIGRPIERRPAVPDRGRHRRSLSLCSIPLNLFAALTLQP